MLHTKTLLFTAFFAYFYVKTYKIFSEKRAKIYIFMKIDEICFQHLTAIEKQYII